MLRTTALLAAAAIGLATGCASPRALPARGDWVFPIAHARSIDADFAAAGARVLHGFPDVIETESFRPGDRLLFGFESFDGDTVARFYIELRSEGGDPGVRDLRLEAGPDLSGTVPTRDLPVLVRVYDESLAIIDEQRSLVPTAVHEAGLYGWVRRDRGRSHDQLPVWNGPRSAPPDEWVESKFAEAVAFELLTGMSRNRALCDRLRTLSIWPSLFQQLGILLGGAVFEFDTDLARLVPQPIAELPAELCYEVHLLLRQENVPLLVGNATVVPPKGPLAMSAGIVTLAGYRGDDPRRHFVARLLAMHQAPAAATQ